MSIRNSPPFRADHVGSFLRPKGLLDARDRFKQGALSKAELRAVEDGAIRDIVKFQEDLGLQGVTDGEFRRTYFHIDFLEQLDGVETRGGIAASFHGKAGAVNFAPPVMHVIGKLRHARPIQTEDFKFLKSVTKRMPKVTIPSPTMLHFRGGRAAISKEAYPDMEAFYNDVAACYREEIKQLGAAGCTYIQLDDTNLAYLCDPKMREGARSRGDDPDELPRRYARLINAAIADRPAGMTICTHLCRGNTCDAVYGGNYACEAEIDAGGFDCGLAGLDLSLGSSNGCCSGLYLGFIRKVGLVCVVKILLADGIRLCQRLVFLHIKLALVLVRLSRSELRLILNQLRLSLS